MKRFSLPLVALGLVAATASTAANAVTVYGVDEINNLVTFDSSAPGTVLSSILINGTTESFQAIDFRSLTNTLYGLGSDRVMYTINTTTGVATAVSGALALSGSTFGFDFNPSIDRLRIVSNTNQNYVFNPNDGSLSGSPGVVDVFYAAGDPGAGSDPDIVASAYTSAAPGGATQLYGLDSNRDTLVTQANSAGTLVTVGATGVNFGSRSSFDILGSDAFAYAGSTLYRVNLATGAFTSLGSTDRALYGIAIAAVPEPATWGMMILGFGLMGSAMRRRSTKVAYA